MLQWVARFSILENPGIVMALPVCKTDALPFELVPQIQPTNSKIKGVTEPLTRILNNNGILVTTRQTG